MSEVSIGKMLSNKRSKAIEEYKYEKGEGRVIKTEEKEDFIIGDCRGSGKGEGDGEEVELAPPGAKHGKPQLGYLQYWA